MNHPFTPALAGALVLMLLSGNVIQAGDAPKRHSLESDYGFMIGHWTCHVTQAGVPDRDLSVEYEWAYDKRMLRESIRLGEKVIGEGRMLVFMRGGSARGAMHLTAAK